MRSSFVQPFMMERVHIPADSIPCFTAKLTVHHMIEVILLWRSFEQKCIPYIEERARTRFGISQVLLMIVSETFLINNCDFALMPQETHPLQKHFSFRSFLQRSILPQR